MDVVTLGAALSIMKKMPDTAASSAAAAEAAADRAEEAARTLTVDDTLSKPGQPADSKAVGDTLAEKLDITDVPNIADNANQLLSEKYVIDTEPYQLRPSGGQGADREFDAIVGGSIIWNQLVQNANKDFTSDSSDTRALFFVLRKSSSPYTALYQKQNVAVGILSSVVSSSFDGYAEMTHSGSERNIRITPVNGFQFTNGHKYLFSLNFTSVDTSTVGGVVTKNISVFDLTAMFGSEIADHIYELEQAEEGAGVAWFRKYFPNDYYDYNPGELMHVSDLQSHDTVGFNLWDEEWEVGQYSTLNGAKNAAAGTRCKNPIKVIGGADYYFYCASRTGSNNFGICWYDSNDSFISSNVDHSKITAPVNAKYLRFFAPNTWYGSVYKNDICINLSWSGTRDGEYEPYVKHSYPLDPSLTLRGIPKLTADGNLTYDGDVYKPDGTVERRYGIVDLGTLTWTVQTAKTGVFKSSGISSLTPSVANLKIANIICDKFITSAATSPMPNNAIAISSAGAIFVKDSVYANVSAADFKAAMSGVYLVYELTAPTTEQADPFQSPQILDPYGIEEYVTTSIVPVGHETKYPENLRAKIEGLPWNFTNLIAPVEAEFKATRNYTSGSLFIVDNVLYKATTNIANGGTITPNTNCSTTTLAEIIAAL